MKLVTYSLDGEVALGVALLERVIDLRRLYQAVRNDCGDIDALAAVSRRNHPDMHDLLNGGEKLVAAAQRALAFIPDNGHIANAMGVLSHSLADVEILPPVPRPGKIIAVGLNYRSHLAELGEPIPQYPILFTKVTTSLIGHGKPIVLPRVSQQVDFEGELAVVIGRRGKEISQQDALAYVAGYTCANDVSAHDIEFRTSQWTSGKMLDTFCPLGPALVTRDDVPDPGCLRLTTTVNGRTVQDACTSDMVFPVHFLISYISSLATLEPGDVILTGTPAGIGCNRDPQVFLQAGDQVSVRIEGIGTLTNPVEAESRS